VIEIPDVFDIEHEDDNHTAFGIGENFFPGTALARLETRFMFEAVLERMHEIELPGSVETLRSNLIDGIKHIPIKFTAEAP